MICANGSHKSFVESISEIGEYIHDWAVRKGWWEKDRDDAVMLMLAVTELAEACEGLRHGNPPDDKIPEFNSAEAELADCVIRILDQCHARGWRLGEAIVAKMKYNETREHRHGGKQF